ncbi:MAG: imidazolonepropionase [Bacteroidota bacterium]
MNLLIKNARQVVTVASSGKRLKVGREMRDLGVIENGTVLVQQGRIAWVGRSVDFSMDIDASMEVIDASDRILLPGFVDPHTHLVFAGSREGEFALRTEGASYRQIAEKGGGILATVAKVRETSKKHLKKLALRHLTEMMKLGTTTVEVKSGYGLDFDNELKMLEAINELVKEELINVVPTFLGAHAVPTEYRDRKSDYIRLIVERLIPYVGTKKLAEFCDVFCEAGYFGMEECEQILEEGKKFGMRPKVHADEFNPSSGAELAARVGAVSADHLEYVNERGIELMGHKGVVATLLPGVSFFLGHSYAPARKLIDAGVPVALATDFNPGSCMCYSMPLMMTMACTQMGMTPEEVITASTLNAAAAVSRSHELGSIEVGKRGDLILLNIGNYRFLPYHFGANHVVKTIIQGTMLEF